jgi:hypothetical protein
LQRLVQLLDVDIDLEEQRTGIFDLASRNYSTVAQDLRARRDNLMATITRLERRPATEIDTAENNPQYATAIRGEDRIFN